MSCCQWVLASASLAASLLAAGVLMMTVHVRAAPRPVTAGDLA